MTQDPKSRQASMFGAAIRRGLRHLHEPYKRCPPSHTTGPIPPLPSIRVPPAESERVSRLPFAPSSSARVPSYWVYLTPCKVTEVRLDLTS
jgi:hypothetical protein